MLGAGGERHTYEDTPVHEWTAEQVRVQGAGCRVHEWTAEQVRGCVYVCMCICVYVHEWTAEQVRG